MSSCKICLFLSHTVLISSRSAVHLDDNGNEGRQEKDLVRWWESLAESSEARNLVTKLIQLGEGCS
jgi:hypothetical protein